MRGAIRGLCLLVLGCAPAPAGSGARAVSTPADPAAEVLAAAERLLLALRDRDTATLRELLDTGARFYSVRLDGATPQLRIVAAGDRTAVFVDARDHERFHAGSAPGARNIPLEEVGAAKDDGRLPMEDHNTRIIVFGGSADEARAVAEEITRNAFHNVSYFGGTLERVRDLIVQ